jgi:hypothetical protein
MSNNDRLNQQLLLLFREIERVQRKRAAPPPPPPPPQAKQFILYRPVTLDWKRLGGGVLALLGGMALALYVTYGSFTPCGALHSKARALYVSAVGAANPLALAFASMIPLDNMIDAMVTERFGSAGPLQCTAVLFGRDWDAMEERMRHQPRS